MILPLGSGRFCVLGRAGMDLYPQPAGKQTAAAELFRADLGGSAANIAVALRRQGQRTALLSALSADPVGDFVRTRLASYNIDLDLLFQTSNGARTSLALAETRPADCQIVIYRNQAADLMINPKLVQKIDFISLKALVITGTALSAAPSSEACLSAAQLARQASCPVVLDLDYRAEAWPAEDVARAAYLELLPQADLVVGNQLEFDILTTADADGFEQAKLVGADRIVIYKQAEQGSILINRGKQTTIATFKVALAKPFGAGDAFLGNILASLAVQDDLVEAVLAGSAAAAYLVSREGCAKAMPDTQQLAEFRRAHADPAISQLE